MNWPWQIRCRLGNGPGYAPTSWVDAGMVRHSVTIERGRADEHSDDEVGTCILYLDNRDGTYQPGIDPHTAIQVEVFRNGVWDPLFYGLIESAPARWPERGDADVQVSAVDGLAWLAGIDVDVAFGQQTTGTRIAAILDAAGWPAGSSDLDAGVVEVDPLDDGEDGPMTIKALHAIREAVEAEDGQMYVAGDGTFTFRDRHARLDVDPAAATFGISNPMFDIVPTYDDFKLFTVGRVEMADGRTVEFESDTAAVYGRRLFEVRDMSTSMIEAEAVAAWAVHRYDTPQVRFQTVDIEGRNLDVLDVAVGLPLGTLVRVVHNPDWGSGVDELVHIERMTHRIAAGSWRTSFELSPYFGAGPWLVLDSSDPVMVLDGDAKLAP